MIIFPKDTVKIYQEISDPECGVDNYGKPRKCNKLKGVVEGDLQAVSPSESRHVFGTQTNNTHNLYLNPDTDIQNIDIVKVDGYNGFFKVVGDPMVHTKLVPHILVLLRHVQSGKEAVCYV